jgi:hypothetical protein
MRPTRRSDKLLVRKLGADTLVYDLTRDRAHCLNTTAALVFELADGHRSIREMAGLVSERLGIGESEPVVRLALDRLSKAKLLETDGASGGDWSGQPVSRRELLSKLKVAAVMLPVVASILAPSAADAATSITSLTCTMTVGACSGVMCSNAAGRCFGMSSMCTCA